MNNNSELVVFLHSRQKQQKFWKGREVLIVLQTLIFLGFVLLYGTISLLSFSRS